MQRRKFSRVFKREAVTLVQERGCVSVAFGPRFGLHENIVSKAAPGPSEHDKEFTGTRRHARLFLS